MCYPYPFNFSTTANPLLLQNGYWGFPCVLINTAALQKAIAASPHHLPPFVVAPLVVPMSAGVSSGVYGSPTPFLELVPGQSDPQPEHAFGPPAAIPEIDLTGLSADEQALLWSAPFPIADDSGLDALAGIGFQGEPTPLQI